MHYVHEIDSFLELTLTIGLAKGEHSFSIWNDYDCIGYVVTNGVTPLLYFNLL